MNRTKKNYIPFLAGMAAMALLACLISASGGGSSGGPAPGLFGGGDRPLRRETGGPRREGEGGERRGDPRCADLHR